MSQPLTSLHDLAHVVWVGAFSAFEEQPTQGVQVTSAMETRSEPEDLDCLAPSYASHGHSEHWRCIAHD